jgi:glycosyltransferase involved in cell wall biosynthesis
MPLPEEWDEPSPLVSVVIPCYNATRYIGDALNSLREQTFRDFEVILVNDGCPDTENLERVLQPYRDEIVYIKSGQWASISSSRNTAIRASHARYIALLDADDVWEPDYLRVQVGLLESDPTIDLIYPNAIYFGEGAWVGKLFMDMNPSEGEVTLKKMILRECTVFIGVTARRESLIRAGLFDPQVRGGEDWDVWIRVLRSGGTIAYHRQPLARYRLRSGSMSSDKLDLLRNGLAVCDKYLNLPDLSAEERGWWKAAARTYRSNADLVLGKQALYAGRRKEAIDLLSRANQDLRDSRVGMAILALRLVPRLLFFYVRQRYPSEYSYLH